jgi:glycosyltransferase involved in cell wall biosynthesis
MDIRPYRFGLLRRLADREDVEHTMYAGVVAAGSGVGVPASLPDVPVAVRPVRNWFWFRQPLKVWWQSGALSVLRSDAEVIVCQEVVSNLTVWVIRLLHRWFGKSLVLIGFFYRPGGRSALAPLRDWLRRRLRASAGAFIAYTERGAAELVAEGVPEEMVFVNGNTLDTHRLIELADGISEADRTAVRRELQLDDSTRVLAFLGRLRPVKRLEVAIETLRLLGDGYVLLVIGDGEEGERWQAASVGLPVHFVGQVYEDEKLARLLSVASVMYLPGSVGLTCVHGFANSLPCLTTSEEATTQTPEYDYVVDGYNGVIFAEADAGLHALSIRRLLADDERLKRLAEGARVTAERLDMDHMADAFVRAVRHARDSVDQRHR